MTVDPTTCQERAIRIDDAGQLTVVVDAALEVPGASLAAARNGRLVLAQGYRHRRAGSSRTCLFAMNGQPIRE